MKKISKFALLILSIVLCISFPAYADELKGGDNWIAEFTNEKEMVSNFSSQSFDDVLDYMQPGDRASFCVTIKNSYHTALDWYMTNKVIESMEDASKTAKGGVYSYKLTYTNPKGYTYVLYDSEAVGGENYRAGLEGLHEATDNLKDYFYLDTLQSGESAKLQLFVLLDGETQGNDYQDTIAKLQMNFAVELPPEPTTVYQKSEPKYEKIKQEDRHIVIQEEDVIVQDAGETRIVHTGDDSHLLIWFIIAGILGILMLVLGIISVRIRKQLSLFFLVFLFAAGSLQVSAKENYFSSSYLYKVRVLSGAQSTFKDGTDCLVIETSPNTTIDLSELLNSMDERMGDSKYYIKGIRESGRDNNTVNNVVGPVFKVTRDMDLVIAYAMKGGDVTYTIRYVNADTGEELLPSQSFVGNIGEKPVVAYKYIAGFVPQAYNLTKTLQADPEKNVFTFQYHRGSNGGGIYVRTEEGEIIYITEDGEVIVDRIPGHEIHVRGEETIIVIDDGGRTGHHAGQNGENEQDGNGEEDAIDNNADTSEDVLHLIDLDEQSVPLANALSVFPFTNDVRILFAPTEENYVLRVFFAVVFGILIALLIFLFIKKDREKKNKTSFDIKFGKRNVIHEDWASISAVLNKSEQGEDDESKKEDM